MISYFKRTIQHRSLKKISSPEIGCWINAVNPSPEEISYLAQKLGLDRSNLESGLDQNELPRLDFVGKDVYLFTKAIPDVSEAKIETYLIAITKNFILTLSQQEPSFVKNILEGKTRFITTQKLKCLIELFALINESFEKISLEMVKRVQKGRKTTKEFGEKELNALLEQEELLNNLVSSYYYMNLLYEKAVRRIKFFEQDKEIIKDLTTEVAQGFNLCKSSLRTISNLRNYYVVLLSNKLNRIITVLTVFTILISFPAAISSIYGMNILLPFQENPLVFYYLIVLIGVVWLGFILYLKKKRIF